jgi:trehalose synthase-fused probable maltokinase
MSALFLLSPRVVQGLTEQLPTYLLQQRWFGGKSRKIRAVRLLEALPLTPTYESACIFCIEVGFVEGPPEHYLLPVVVCRKSQPSEVVVLRTIASITLDGVPVRLLDDCAASELSEPLFALIDGNLAFTSTSGWIVKGHRSGKQSLAPSPLAARLLWGEQSNTSLRYDERWVLKLLRRLTPGVHPDLEIGQYLAQHTSFRNVPALEGWLEVVDKQGQSMVAGLLHQWVPNHGDAWLHTLSELRVFFERVGERDKTGQEVPKELLGVFFTSASLLGRRTAELHQALAQPTSDPAFAPEPLPPNFAADLAQRVQAQLTRILSRLKATPMTPRARLLADQVLAKHAQGRPQPNPPPDGEGVGKGGPADSGGLLTRVHGDYHLGQVLYTGSDFYILDFEGEPARSLDERRRKDSPLRDVAGMLRSFHYALHYALPGGIEHLDRWGAWWYPVVCRQFLDSYLEAARLADFLPRDPTLVAALLDWYLLEKACYELAYELDNRPDWVHVPLQGLLQLMEYGSSQTFCNEPEAPSRKPRIV